MNHQRLHFHGSKTQGCLLVISSSCWIWAPTWLSNHRMATSGLPYRDREKTTLGGSSGAWNKLLAQSVSQSSCESTSSWSSAAMAVQLCFTHWMEWGPCRLSKAGFEGMQVLSDITKRICFRDQLLELDLFKLRKFGVFIMLVLQRSFPPTRFTSPICLWDSKKVKSCKGLDALSLAM